MSAKTLSIHLPTGDPEGIRIAEISNRIIRAYVIPRKLLGELRKYSELSKPALYLLLSQDGSELYIGETEDFSHRQAAHEANKAFWDVLVLFVAKDGSLEKSDVGYLESIAIDRATAAQKAHLDNKKASSKNNLHPFKIPAIEEFFEDCCLLTSAFGFPVFDVLTEQDTAEENLWFFDTNKTRAKGVFEGNQFTVLAGTVIDTYEAPSWVKSAPKALQQRKQLLAAHATLDAGKGVYVLNSNVTLDSVNKAAGFVSGRNNNAWISWRNKAGQTMDEVLR